MKKSTISIMMICIALLLPGCKKKAATTPELTSGIDLTNLDTTASPKDDFYQYACGGWMKKFPIPDEYSRYGNFDRLAETNLTQLKDVISEMAAKKHKAGTIEQKIGDLYNLGMDSARLEKQGNEPIQEALTKIAQLKSREELTAQLIEMHNNGTAPFFGIFGESDPDNSSMVIAWLSQSGLGIGDRDYYLKAEHKAIREQYITLIDNLLQLANYPILNPKAANTKVAATNILALETHMAEACMPKEAMRDPFAMHNIYSIEQLDKTMSALDMSQYLRERGLGDLESINVCQPKYFEALNKMLSQTDLETIKAYLAWNLIRHAAPYLSHDFADASFEFYGHQLTGATAQKPRWKRVISTVNGALGEAVGQIYVDHYFSADAKTRMQNLVSDLQVALKERLMGNTWMDDSTKAKAVNKLSSMIVKIGYPDEWRDYSSLEIKDDSYYANIVRAERFESAYQLGKIGKPTDPTEWQMTPQTVNAYYNPSTNEICFPAAILQPPFFNVKADDAVNYGAIGVVIGHEMTHGFDDQGRLYDNIGNLHNWWSEHDGEAFKARTQILVDHFNAIEVAPGLFANGAFTLGENIADNGGLNVSFTALKKAIAEGRVKGEMDGFTPEQRFFLAYAGVWACNIRDAEIVRRTQSDPHSLAKWRVNGTLPHINAFAETYDLKEGDGMYLAPEKRAVIW